ncbi:PucR family transcriptional regulator [Solirubrobacter soli]|uniref:PucR family transcriptional regulator n=1 Tax=Solirubrobacter soli TaxID=363832 RepID=UPI00048501F3|nr:PucR family transcriptional regulator [Solirubrobacter soli]
MHNDVLRRIIERISLDDLAAGLQRRLEELPAFRDFESDQTAAVLRSNVDQFVRWLLDGTPPDVEQLEGPIRARLSEGMTMEDGLLIYRTAAQAGWDALVAAADDDERLALLSGADVLFGYMNAVTDVFHRAGVPTAEQRAHEQLERALASDGAFTPFVAVLEDGGAGGHAALAAELRREGAIAVAEGARTAGLLRGDVTWPAAALVALGEPRGGGAEPAGCLAAAAPSDGRGAGPEPAGGLAAALDELRALADIARGRRGIVRPAEYLPELLLHASPRYARALVERVYGPLTDELARTLQALVEHGFDKSAAAAALPVHRNTLNYRVARIEERTGLDLNAPRDRGLAWLASLA